jgi:hypothetical protein
MRLVIILSVLATAMAAARPVADAPPVEEANLKIRETCTCYDGYDTCTGLRC